MDKRLSPSAYLHEQQNKAKEEMYLCMMRDIKEVEKLVDPEQVRLEEEVIRQTDTIFQNTDICKTICSLSSIMRCCSSCGSRFGYFSLADTYRIYACYGEDAIKNLLSRFRFDYGFWNYIEGCGLKRNHRSRICLFYLCSKVDEDYKEEMKRVKGQLYELTSKMSEFDHKPFLPVPEHRDERQLFLIPEGHLLSCTYASRRAG